ncbi:class I SAM-dependent methyltransferase [Nesterenkonia sp. Act20]|uniref:class I SAM-dependent methyltransferase n=1 Tax=Nesterenkonia sp. Act20 TaxID=1483432 RepID=UPI001C45D088
MSVVVGAVSVLTENWGIAALAGYSSLGAAVCAGARVIVSVDANRASLVRLESSGKDLLDHVEATTRKFSGIVGKHSVEVDRQFQELKLHQLEVANSAKSETEELRARISGLSSALTSRPDSASIEEIKTALEDLDLRGKKTLNLARSEFPAVKDLLNESVRLFAEEASSARAGERRILKLLKDNDAVLQLKARVEQSERRILSITETERLRSAERWEIARTAIEAQEISVESALSLLKEHDRRLTASRNSVEEDQGHAEGLVRELRAEMQRQEERLSKRVSEVGSASVAKFDSASERLEQKISRHVTLMSREETRQVQALLQLVPKVPNPPVGLPATGGSAMDPEALLHLVALLEQTRPKMIVELGSGASTVWMGHIARQYGAKVISLDHLDKYLKLTQEAVARHGLTDVVECRFAPLEKIVVDGRDFEWYSESALGDTRDIDFLLVDGPPKGVGDAARFPALPVLKARLARNAVVVLDDTHRGEEQEILEQWLSANTEFEQRDMAISRLGVIQRNGEQRG